MKRTLAILGVVAIFGTTAVAVAAPGRGSSRSGVRSRSTSRSYARSRAPRARTRSYARSNARVRSYARSNARSYARSNARSYARSRARGYIARPRARAFRNNYRRAVRPRSYYGRYRGRRYYRPGYPVAYAPTVSTTTWCADPLVPDSLGRAVCSTNGALMVDSTGAVIYLNAGGSSSWF